MRYRVNAFDESGYNMETSRGPTSFSVPLASRTISLTYLEWEKKSEALAKHITKPDTHRTNI